MSDQATPAATAAAVVASPEPVEPAAAAAEAGAKAAEGAESSTSAAPAAAAEGAAATEGGEGDSRELALSSTLRECASQCLCPRRCPSTLCVCVAHPCPAHAPLSLPSPVRCPALPGAAHSPPPSPPHATGVPAKATKKPVFDASKKGKCTVEGCDKRVMSMTLNVSRYLVVPLPVWGSRDSKHHCRHCLRRVCSEHFKKTAKGYKVCSVCFDAGEQQPAAAQRHPLAAPSAHASPTPHTHTCPPPLTPPPACPGVVEDPDAAQGSVSPNAAKFESEDEEEEGKEGKEESKAGGGGGSAAAAEAGAAPATTEATAAAAAATAEATAAPTPAAAADSSATDAAAAAENKPEEAGKQ